MLFYEYIYRDSVIHQLDPRTKIAWLLALTFIIFSQVPQQMIVASFFLTLLLILASKLPLRAIWNSSKVFIILFPIGFMILFSLLLWDIHRGVIDGFFFALKFIVLTLFSVLFTMSTSPRDLMLSLTKLKVPYELAFMLTIAIRFVPVITREINHVIDAQKARAHKLEFSPRHPIRSLEASLPILIPTFYLLLLKSFDLSLSIEARAFRAKKERTYPPRLKFLISDYVALAFLGMLLTVVLYAI